MAWKNNEKKNSWRKRRNTVKPKRKITIVK